MVMPFRFIKNGKEVYAGWLDIPSDIPDDEVNYYIMSHKSEWRPVRALLPL